MNPIYIHAEIKPKIYICIDCYWIRTISGKFKNQSQYMRWWLQDNTNLWQIRTQKWHNLSTLSIKYFHSHVLLKMKMTTNFKKFLISGGKTCLLVKLYLFTYKLTNFLKNRVNLPKKIRTKGFIAKSLIFSNNFWHVSWEEPFDFEWTLTQVSFFVKLRSWLIARTFPNFYFESFHPLSYLLSLVSLLIAKLGL